jgi:hypothetical protein
MLWCWSWMVELTTGLVSEVDATRKSVRLALQVCVDDTNARLPSGFALCTSATTGLQ